jgi:hypothetical protein
VSTWYSDSLAATSADGHFHVSVVPSSGVNIEVYGKARPLLEMVHGVVEVYNFRSRLLQWRPIDWTFTCDVRQFAKGVGLIRPPTRWLPRKMDSTTTSSADIVSQGTVIRCL